MKRWIAGLAVFALLLLLRVGGVQAAVNIDLVTVGKPGNTGELSGASVPGGFGPDRICGAVGYEYQIGEFEVTAGQYTEFLNAVAKTDTYGLYNPNSMWSNEYGCKIEQHESLGSYFYTVTPDWTNRPVNNVSWGDAARFCNWLHNGQLTTGVQDASTTEDGSYYLNGATSREDLMQVTRKTNATWVLPTEDEWYKAAYYDANKQGGAGYYDYPTKNDSQPSNVLSPVDTNNANFNDNGYTIGSPYYRTEVGAFAESVSAYGTFDQGGNVREWNETAFPELASRGLRGGSFYSSEVSMTAGDRAEDTPFAESPHVGFRVALVEQVPTVPEPATIIIWSLLGGIGIAIGWWRRRRTA